MAVDAAHSRWAKALRAFRIQTNAADARHSLSRDGLPQAPRYNTLDSNLSRLIMASLDRPSMSIGELVLRTGMSQEQLASSFREAEEEGFGSAFTMHSAIDAPHELPLTDYLSRPPASFTPTHISIAAGKSRSLARAALDRLAGEPLPTATQSS